LYVLAVILAVLAASCAQAAWGDQQEVPGARSDRSKESFSFPELEGYLSFIISRPTLEGDFDGQTFFQGAGLVLLVPEVEPSLGFGAALGVKRRLGKGLKNALGAELYIVRSNHDGTWMDVPGSGVLWDIGAGLSWHILADRRIQPYFRGSFGFTGFDFNVDDALELDTCPFAGTKWAFGLGLSAYLTPKWFLDIGLSMNSFQFGAPADIRSIVLEPPLSSSTLDFESRISFSF
jgi:opacity protein-like surface antigen